LGGQGQVTLFHGYGTSSDHATYYDSTIYDR
jgi:hypothetical protein